MLFLWMEERLSGAEEMREYWQVWNFRGRLVDLYLSLSVQVLTRAVFMANEKRLTNWMKEKKSHILRFWPNTTTCKCFYFTCKHKGILTTKKYRISLTVLIPCLTQFASVFLTMLDHLICPCRYRIFEKQTNKYMKKQ